MGPTFLLIGGSEGCLDPVLTWDRKARERESTVSSMGRRTQYPAMPGDSSLVPGPRSLGSAPNSIKGLYVPVCTPSLDSEAKGMAQS